MKPALVFVLLVLVTKSQESPSIPDTSTIPPGVLESLGVDVFFSLWSVIFERESLEKLDNSPFTILAPINYSRTNPEIFVNQEKIARDTIINHVILGETVRPESLLNSKVRTSLGGKELSFSIDSKGELWVNDVRILGWAIASDGIIFALEDYLFTKEPPLSNLTEPSFQELLSEEHSVPRDNHDTSNYSLSSNEIEPFENVDWVQKEVCRNVSDSKVTLFNNIRICVEEWVKVPKGFHEESTLLHKLPKLLSGDFLSEFEESLNGFKEMAYFKDYFGHLPNKTFFFKNDTFYTVFLPNDGAFRQFHPIDWGFNAFKVDAFVQSVILNAFIEGKVSSSKAYEALGGESYEIQVQNQSIYLPSTSSKATKMASSDRFDVYAIDSLPFVNQVTIEEYKKEYGYLESGPLINEPFVGSPFLSHAWHRLQELKEYSYMVEYLKETLDFGDSAPFNPNDDPSIKENGYTLFVPRDDAFWRLLIQDAGAPDPFILDSNFRLNVLNGHLVHKRLYLNSLRNNEEIYTSDNRTFIAQKDNETGIVSFNDGRQKNIKVLNGNNLELWVFNLGNIIFIDKVLFVQTSDIIKVMEDSFDIASTIPTTTDRPITTTEISEIVWTTEAISTSVNTFPPSRTPSSLVDRGEETPKYLKDILNPRSTPKIIYVNNKRVALLHEQDFDSLFLNKENTQ